MSISNNNFCNTSEINQKFGEEFITSAPAGEKVSETLSIYSLSTWLAGQDCLIAVSSRENFTFHNGSSTIIQN
jgi:hypothetical protein